MRSKKRKENSSKKGSGLSSLSHKVLRLIAEQKEPIGFKGIERKLGHGKIPSEELSLAIEELLMQGKILRKESKFCLPDIQTTESTKKHTRAIIEGYVDMTNSGAAFIVCEEVSNDIYVPSNKMGTALEGDRVRVKIAHKKSGRRMEGEIIEVLERSKDTFVGIINISKQFSFLISERQMPVDFFIPLKKTNGATNGDKVLIRVTEWPSESRKNPTAEVIAVLGKPGQNNAEMLSILADNGFPLEFNRDTTAEADALQTSITEEEILRRRDMRPTPTLTIDPEDAKDFDDALSCQLLDNGNYEIGVHIADVSHYVAPNSAMDREAQYRATSVYLVDRVLPMFPEKLSNLVCSLRPQEEKLCFSVVFELTSEAEIVGTWFGRTVIYSDRRFDYGEAQIIIDKQEGDMCKELTLLDKLAKKLRAKRIQNGSIEFGSEEVRFRLDEHGKPIEVYVKPILDTNRLIEEFMLLANRKTAALINSKKTNGQHIPSVNRIHDLPDTEKLKDFKLLAESFGHSHIHFDTPRQISESLNRLLAEIKGQPEQHILETLAIRTMAKAAYSTKTDVGHYGLAFKDYTHFTSPIRRYPDVMTHRILAECLSKSPHYDLNKEALEKRCEHCSVMERKAMEAERQSVKYKQVEYLSVRIGQVFEGTISGVVKFGFFVELNDNKCEGLVSIDSLIDDHYYYDDKQHAILSYHKKKKYQLGMNVKVRVIQTSLTSRTIDMNIVP